MSLVVNSDPDKQSPRLAARSFKASPTDKPDSLASSILLFILVVAAPPAVACGIAFSDHLNFGSISADDPLAIAVAVVAATIAVFGALRLARGSRTITIGEDEILIAERRLFRTTERREAFAAFTDVRQEQKATLGGWQHRLILSQKSPNRHISCVVGDESPEALSALQQICRS